MNDVAHGSDCYNGPELHNLKTGHWFARFAVF
jgi:hypothetical protein